MAVSLVTMTNSKRKADKMESNQPEELRTVKVKKTESVERKYQNYVIFRLGLKFSWSCILNGS